MTALLDVTSPAVMPSMIEGCACAGAMIAGAAAKPVAPRKNQRRLTPDRIFPTPFMLSPLVVKIIGNFARVPLSGQSVIRGNGLE